MILPFKEDLVKLVEKASTITERLGSGFFFNEAQEKDDIVNARIEEWCQVVAQGNQDKFEKRLALDGLNISKVRRALGSKRITDEQHLPTWMKTLHEVIQATEFVSLETLEESTFNKHRFFYPQNSIPFQEVFLSFIHLARQKLIARAGSSYHLLSEESYALLELGLLRQLSYICSQSLYLEFSIFRNFTQHTLVGVLGQLSGSHSKQLYRKFIKNMLKGGLLSFFQEYSVLARLAATATDLWVDATLEFILRLASDWSEIQTTFQPEKELGQVVAVKPSLSDLHRGGRSVIKITFASGLNLIYKPRNLAIESAYFNLLAWFNQHDVPLPFKLLKVINHSTHGWVEFVEPLVCKDEQEVKQYYRRAGMLLCLLYVLQATDCHFENIIACGKHPVLIDMEALLQHRVWEDVNAGSESLGNWQLQDSVLRTGLLPHWEFGLTGESFDFSGLGGVGQQQTSFHVLKWNNINTDSMMSSYEYGKTPLQTNLPSLNGVTLPFSHYTEDLIHGFQQMYRFFVEYRELILASHSPLKALAHQPTRFIFRNTQTYHSILEKTLNPKYLRDGVDRSIQLDVLSRAMLSSDSKCSFWPLLKIEEQALEQMDIPLFTSYPDSDALTLAPNETVEKYFKEPSLNRVIACLNNLNDEDLEKQIGFIKGSLYSRTANEVSSSSLSENVGLNLDAVTPLITEEIVQQAIAIALDLEKRAICSAEGSVDWITFAHIIKAQRFQLQPMEFGLYDGRCGVALFLAALEAVTGDNRFRKLTVGALQPIGKVLHNSNPKFGQKIIKRIGIGGAMGIGSILYGLVRISQLLGEPALLQDAKIAALLITPECIAADNDLDVMLGAAGTILGLLTLYKATTDSTVLEQAIICGHHLLNNRTPSDAGLRTWATLNGKLLTGFSHGAAGIVYALLQLYETTSDVAFLEAAQEAITYERSVFSSEAINWPDLRWEKTSFTARSWCHGAPGIGLARLGSLKILDTPEIRQEIEVALKKTQQSGLQGVDNICCGNFGRTEVLLVAAQQLSRPDLLQTVKKQASSLIARTQQTSYFYLSHHFPKDAYIPSLFMGTAGIGYQLLRIAYPNRLSSVLLFN
ncbi:type 2 lanthipeptide synthetase LanM family protein [uncultured Nostoc sp.]|uniref:type 2 lanthipeptide synthetase LanM family protein n=1 Tax=uncultured Nostoc sp. TaxID=340711 RepID=UPI0035CBE873